ncbi:uncharacterized protein si:ch211-142k18.1 [Trichomycterus rosablanca]|uniref:uncharacterized protein si:ch211-142k18.1 n=1 Tax=Trichomycterus rosablanca TaxID=2290929 RepID=UPI002F356985
MDWPWTLSALLFIALLTSVHCQSGDGGDWGSGSMAEFMFNSSMDLLPKSVRDDPGSPMSTDMARPLFEGISEKEAGDCSVSFYTSQTLSRRLRVAREELAYLKTLQHGNQAVVENLIQFVGAEMGDRRYEEIVQENVVDVKENHASCEEMMTKATDELENQLEGDVLKAESAIQKIKEESVTFEAMLRSTANIASRLEIFTQTLHMQLTEQLRKGVQLKDKRT